MKRLEEELAQRLDEMKRNHEEEMTHKLEEVKQTNEEELAHQLDEMKRTNEEELKQREAELLARQKKAVENAKQVATDLATKRATLRLSLVEQKAARFGFQFKVIELAAKAEPDLPVSEAHNRAVEEYKEHEKKEQEKKKAAAAGAKAATADTDSLQASEGSVTSETPKDQSGSAIAAEEAAAKSDPAEQQSIAGEPNQSKGSDAVDVLENRHEDEGVDTPQGPKEQATEELSRPRLPVPKRDPQSVGKQALQTAHTSAAPTQFSPNAESFTPAGTSGIVQPTFGQPMGRGFGGTAPMGGLGGLGGNIPQPGFATNAQSTPFGQGPFSQQFPQNQQSVFGAPSGIPRTFNQPGQSSLPRGGGGRGGGRGQLNQPNQPHRGGHDQGSSLPRGVSPAGNRGGRGNTQNQNTGGGRAATQNSASGWNPNSPNFNPYATPSTQNAPQSNLGKRGREDGGDGGGGRGGKRGRGQ